MACLSVRIVTDFALELDSDLAFAFLPAVVFIPTLAFATSFLLPGTAQASASSRCRRIHSTLPGSTRSNGLAGTIGTSLYVDDPAAKLATSLSADSLPRSGFRKPFACNAGAEQCRPLGVKRTSCAP